MSGSAGKSCARAIEVQLVVVFAQLHPRRGGAIPLADHVVVAGIRAILAARPDEVEQHARDFPVHRRLAEIDLLTVGDLHPEPLEAPDGRDVAGRLHRRGARIATSLCRIAPRRRM